MGIFSEHAMKYHEAGIPVIPLKGKIPLVRGWQEWSAREQTEDELQTLIAKFPNANIGAVLGLWACAVDVDTDAPEIMRAIPYSPLTRVGAKGAVFLFRPSDIKNAPGVKVPIEFLNHGRQVVLPPSIHPDTNQPYVWTGSSDLTESLPEITQGQFMAAVRLCEKMGLASKPRARIEGGDHDVHLTDAGRNNRLTAVAYAMACDDTPVDEAVERLLDLDGKEHEVPWFSDATEPHGGKRPRETARRFYVRALKKAEANGDRLGPISININNNSPPKPQTNEPVAQAPKPRGMIRLFQDYCNATANGSQEALGLGGGLAFMAALASNRFYTRTATFPIWPNLYIMNLAHSGFGKETPQRAIDELLMSSGLLGAATYKSGSSIVMGLPEQPMRLDVIDECSMLLKAMGSKEDYKADIVDVMSSLYSKSSSYFHGFTAVGSGKNFGACWNPCVNILGSTTPAGFKGSVSKDMAAKGLLPRFLLFWQQDVGEFKRGQDPKVAERLLVELRRLTRRVLDTKCREYDPVVQENLMQISPEEMRRFDPQLLEMSDGAQRAITDIQERYFNEGKVDPESFESAFKNRFAQHTAKLALLDALGMGLAEIGVDSVEWAHSVVQWQWRTVRPLYELASAENPHQRDVFEIMQWVKMRGQSPRADLVGYFSKIPRFRLDDILKNLEDAECIESFKLEHKGPGRRAVVYRFVKNLL